MSIDILKDMLTFNYTTPEGEELTVDFSHELLDFDVPRKKLVELPATYGFVGSVAVMLMGKAKEFEIELEAWIAEEDDRLRVAGATGESNIKQSIRKNQLWAQKRLKINEAWTQYLKAKIMMDALALKYGVLDLFEGRVEKEPFDTIKPEPLQTLQSLTKTKRSTRFEIPKVSVQAVRKERVRKTRREE